jgi:hypothetical protein
MAHLLRYPFSKKLLRPPLSAPQKWAEGSEEVLALAPVAAMYGVSLVPLPRDVAWSVWVEGIDELGLEGQPISETGYCHEDRRVYCWGEVSDEFVFHELCHLILHHPRLGPEVPEELILMPFELALARTFMDADQLERVHELQEKTTLMTGDELGDFSNYTRRWFWKEGLARCRQLGILDAQNRPTWRYPDWSRIELKGEKDLRKIQRAFWRRYEQSSEAGLWKWASGQGVEAVMIPP